jgi:peptidoglycan/LPS O-acetylase OafA/YrhL
LHADLYFGAFWHSDALFRRITGHDYVHIQTILDMFFLLSGFVMSHVYARRIYDGGFEETVGFFVTRTARVCPLYFITLAAVVIVAPHSFSPRWIDLGTASLINQATFSGFRSAVLAWNYPSWSLQVEMLCYLLFPLIVGVIVRHSRKSTPILGLLFCATILFLISHRSGSLDIVFGYKSVVRGLIDFLAGVFLYEAWRYGWADKYRRVVVVTAFVSLIAFVFRKQDTLLVVADACLILLCLDRRWPLFSIMNARALKWFGQISFSTYLWHVTIHYLIAFLIIVCGITTVSNVPLAILICVSLTVVGTLIVATWSVKYIEGPSRSWVRSSLSLVTRRFALRSTT